MSDPHYYSEQAERGVVAAVMANGERALDEIGGIIHPDHLFVATYRLVYLACFDLYAAGKEIGLITITHQLRENGDLQKCGGAGFVSEIQRDGIDISSGVIFAATILHRHRIRKAMGVLEWANLEITKTIDYGFFDELENRVLDIGDVSHEENRVPSAVANVKAEITRFEKGEKTVGFQTGVPSWDYALNGIVPGRYYALAARPGAGKTALAEQATMNLLAMGKAVLFFSQDMSAEMLLKRMACRLEGVPFKDFEHGQCNPSQLSSMRRVLDEMAQQRLYVLSPNRLTGESLRSIVRTYKRRHNIDCVFLDHIQLLDAGKDLREGLTRASIQIRQSATQSGVAHIVLAHLNREAKDNIRPRASDIKEFDQLFGDCDALVLLWTEQKQYENHRLTIKFTVAKNRYGPICEDAMSFYGPTMKFDKGEKYHDNRYESSQAD